MGGLIGTGGLLSELDPIGKAITGAGGDPAGLYHESPSGMAKDAAAQRAYQDEITKAEEEIRAETNLTEQEKADRSVEGEQRLAEGGSGFDVSNGSPLMVQFAQYASDAFKGRVAVFNGIVNVQADQGAAAMAIAQGNEVASASMQQSVYGLVSTASELIPHSKTGGTA